MFHKILQKFYSHLQSYCKIIECRTGKCCFWDINNSLQVLDTLKKFGIVTHGLYSADFTTLFTKLPHSTVKQNITKLINLCFKNSGKQYVSVSYSGSFFLHKLSWKIEKVLDLRQTSSYRGFGNDFDGKLRHLFQLLDVSTYFRRTPGKLIITTFGLLNSGVVWIWICTKEPTISILCTTIRGWSSGNWK